MAEDVSLFRKRSVSRLVTELRKKLKENGMNLLVNYFYNGIDLTIKQDENVEESFCLQLTEDNSLFFQSYYSCSDEEQNWLKTVFLFIEDTAKKLKVDFIYSNSGEHLLNFGYQYFMEYPGEDYPVYFVGAAPKTEKGTIYYKEMKIGLLEKKLKMVIEAEKAVEFIIGKFDATFVTKGVIPCTKHISIPFYYEGFDGRIIVYYEEPLKIRLFKGNIRNGEVITEYIVNSMSEYSTTFRLMVLAGSESVGFLKLTSPPKKHFEDYCTSNYLRMVTNELFDLLTNEMDPKEIELKILTEGPPVQRSYKGIRYISLLDRYFIINPEFSFFEIYKTAYEAFTKFNELCQEVVKREYEEKLAEIEKVKKEILQTINDEKENYNGSKIC